jgi:4-diphosphocytidyl-2-C-methyl-D-erythritol kinase
LKSCDVRVRAYAKINLSLRVLGVRPDGYHELRTIFQSIALHDTLAIRARRGPFALRCSDPRCPADRTNLVWRAAEHAWRASGRRGAPRDVEIALMKRIPVQAGLGGGSSDAAAALRALGSLWRVPPARLRDLGASLGADVPYFLEGGTVLGLDRGDLLYPLTDCPAAWVVLVLPAFGVSTADAYRWWDKENGARTSSRPSTPRGELRNDLQKPVAARHPDIVRVVKALERAGAFHAAMSGSGSALFGLFDRRAAAERAGRGLAAAGRRTVLTRTVNRSAYQRLAGIPASRINLPFAPRHSDHS